MSSDMDHMSLEFCQALANTLKLKHLDEDDRDLIRERLMHHRFQYAYMAYHRGDLLSARKRFACAIEEGNSHPQTLALTASCYLPTWLHRQLRSIKHSASL
jgi:hypothetical protein